MRVYHPVYGFGNVVAASNGTFAWGKFDKKPRAARPNRSGGHLAVSLRVCRKVY